MKNETALSTERQPSTEEVAAAISAACNYEFSDEERKLARQVRNFGTVTEVTVTQDFNKFINPK